MPSTPEMLSRLFPCSVVQYFNEVTQCWRVWLSTYVSNVATRLKPQISCNYFNPTAIFILFRPQIGSDYIYPAATWLWDIILITRRYTCIIQNNWTDLRTRVNIIRFLVRVNATSRLVEMPRLLEMSRLVGMTRLVEMSRLVEIPRLVSWKCHDSSRGNYYFHGKLWHFTREILRVATRVHACKNELIIERYRNYM